MRSRLQESLHALEKNTTADRGLLELLIRQCGNAKALEEGRRLHEFIKRNDIPRFLSNLLVEMYGKCGSLMDGQRAFDEIQHQNVFSWTMLMSAYLQNGNGEETLKILARMCLNGVRLDRVALITALDACACTRAFRRGKSIHLFLEGSELESQVFVQNTLINMYSKCERMSEAKHLFDGMPEKDLVSWNTMITGYAQNGHYQEAVDLFLQMQQKGVTPDRISFISALDACSNTSTLEMGREIHMQMKKCGLKLDSVLGTALLNMYGRSGSMNEASMVFREMSPQDTVTWNAMMAVALQNGNGSEALELFREMDVEGVRPNFITFIIAIDCCCALGCLSEGKMIDSLCELSGDVAVGNAMANMYWKCGSAEDVKRVFDELCKKKIDNLVSWTTMISTYAHQGLAYEALLLFRKMEWNGMEMDKVTFVCVLEACASSGSVKEGKEVHSRIIQLGLDSVLVIGNSIVNMYGKCGKPNEARDAFERMIERDRVTWNAMLCAYAQNGKAREALNLFQTMDVTPDKVTYLCALDACSSLCDVSQGRRIHAMINENGVSSERSVGNALVHMYAKCGTLESGMDVFYKMKNKDVITWTTVIAAYAQTGHIHESQHMFHKMINEGIVPNEITFVSVLFSCSHVGKLKKGRSYFVSMQCDYGILPKASHYGCMVDLLGRSGHLEYAEDVIDSIPYEADEILWTSLLDACSTHKDTERGERAAEHLIKLQPTNSGPYILLSNMYVALERWDDVERVNQRMLQLCRLLKTSSIR